MIQIWNRDEEGKTTKYAYFADGTARFATVASFASADMVRHALLDSNDVRTDIRPRRDKSILWHEDDRETIAAWYQRRIDDTQYEILNQAIGADIYRYIVYILKFLELMSVELGLRSMRESVILGYEAGSEPESQQALAATWATKSNAWLSLVGIAEREASRAKHQIAQCENDNDMRAIVEAFPAKLSEALSVV